MKIRKGTLLDANEASAIGDDRKRDFESIPDVEGQELSVLYVECPSCKVVSRLTVDTDGPMWGICSNTTCGAMIRP